MIARPIADWGGWRAHFCFSFPFFYFVPFFLGGCRIIEELASKLCMMQPGCVIYIKTNGFNVIHLQMYGAQNIPTNKCANICICIFVHTCTHYLQLPRAFKWNSSLRKLHHEGKSPTPQSAKNISRHFLEFAVYVTKNGRLIWKWLAHMKSVSESNITFYCWNFSQMWGGHYNISCVLWCEPSLGASLC